MDEQAGGGPPQWKSARTYSSTATGFAIILFGALIASLPAMWSGVGPFLNALSWRQWVDKNKTRIDEQYKEQFSRDVRNYLAGISLPIEAFAAEDKNSPCYIPGRPENESRDDRETRTKPLRLKLINLFPKAQPSGDIQADEDHATSKLLELRKEKDCRAVYLAAAVEMTHEEMGNLRSSGLNKFLTTQKAARQTPFKLLGLEFSVNYFWAWDVWYMFLGGGVLYLWLTRRGVLLRCRLAFIDLAQNPKPVVTDVEKSPDTPTSEERSKFELTTKIEAQKKADENGQQNTTVSAALALAPAREPGENTHAEMAVVSAQAPEVSKAVISPGPADRDSLPLWVRPLPANEPWVNQWTNPSNMDCFLDPNSLLCLVLMWGCLLLGFYPVASMAICSDLLLIGVGKPDVAVVVHAAVFCITTGCMVAVLLDWYLPRSKNRDPKAWLGKPGAIDRRSLLFGVGSMMAGIACYVSPVNRAVAGTLLRKGRFNQVAKERSARKRRRKSDRLEVEEGFYQLENGLVIYVPANRRVRSPAGVGKMKLTPWSPPLEVEKLAGAQMYPTALVPYARAACKELLRGIRHRKTPEEKAKLLENPEVRRKYESAFNLVKWAIDHDGEQNRTGRNLQLYDLLAAVAICANSEEKLESARQSLKTIEVSQRPILSLGWRTRQRDLRAPVSPKPPDGQPSQIHSHHAKHKAKSRLNHKREYRLKEFIRQRLGSDTSNTTKSEGNHPAAAAFNGSWDPRALSKENPDRIKISNDIRLLRNKERKRKRIFL